MGKIILIQIINQRHILMSKKGHKHEAHKQSRGKKEHITRFDHDSDENIMEGSARRRLKKMSEVNISEQMLPSENEDNIYLVKDEGEEQQDTIKLDEEDEVQKRRHVAEQIKKPKKQNKSQELDKFITKQTEKEKSKPKLQLTIEETMRLNRERKKQQSKSHDQFIFNDKDQNFDAPSREKQAKREEIYKEFNGSMDDEQKLIEMAIKLSLTAASNKHQHLDDYAYEDPKPKQSKFITKSIPVRQKQKQRLLKPQPKQKQHKSEAKKQVKRGKSVSKQPKQGPFAGLVIAFTGGYEGIDKDKLIEVCIQLGAQCPKSITKKCNLLMQGSHVEDQFKRRLNQPINETQKSKDAKEKGITIITFDKLEDFFVEKTGMTIDDHINKNQVKTNPISSYMSKPIEVKQQQWGDINTGKIDNRMWTDKYKPSSLQQVIGQSSQIRSLREWLQSWQDIQIRGNKRDVKQSKGWNAAGNINSPAALISGDPGIGKTTTARLLAIKYNYSVTQFNASDVRNKSGINLLQSTSYNLDIFHNLTRPLIIMDQVDGMSSGDRGGVAAIINMIKSTKVPIICICNDRQSQKIRSLAGHCLDIKFHKPHKGMIVKRLKEILSLEGGSGEDRALEQLVQTFQNDMRQLLTYLQVIFKTVSKKVTIDALSGKNKSTKDSSLMINPFDAARKLLNRSQFSGMKISQRTQCFFVDSSLVPIMVHQNLLSSTRKTPLNPTQFHGLVEGMSGMVIGDMLDRTIRKEQEWGLMPSFGFMTCVYSTQKISESLGFPQFPSWLGKFSSQRKMKRLAKEFKNAIFPLTANSSWKVAKNLYAPLITLELSQLLKQESVEEAVILMQQYRINPLMINDHLASLYYSTTVTNPLQDISSTTKGKLTRLFNKRHEQLKLAKATGKTKGKIKPEKQIKFDPLMEQPQQIPDQQPQEEKQNQESKPKVKGKSKPKEVKKKK